MKRTIVLPVIALVLIGCGKPPLDRETAMRLVQGRVVETVAGSFHATADYVMMPNLGREYQQLINAGLLKCGDMLCDLVPTGPGFSAAMGNLQFVAGSLITSGVSGVAQTGDNTATADIQLSFQPTPFYAQHKSALDALTAGAPSMGTGAVAARTRRTLARAIYQRFDDGWRLQAVQ